MCACVSLYVCPSVCLHACMHASVDVSKSIWNEYIIYFDPLLWASARDFGKLYLAHIIYYAQKSALLKFVRGYGI